MKADQTLITAKESVSLGLSVNPSFADKKNTFTYQWNAPIHSGIYQCVC